MNALADTIGLILSLGFWLIFIYVAIEWAITLGIANPSSTLVARTREFTHALLNPLLRPIRRIIPNIAGFDLSPAILLILIYFLSRLIPEILRGLF